MPAMAVVGNEYPVVLGSSFREQVSFCQIHVAPNCSRITRLEIALICACSVCWLLTPTTLLTEEYTPGQKQGCACRVGMGLHSNL